MADNVPDSIRELESFLEGRGNPPHLVWFGSELNQVFVSDTPQGSVRIVADRGKWFVELALPMSGRYFDIAVWRACLSGDAVSLDVDPLDLQVEQIKLMLSEGSTELASPDCLVRQQAVRSEGQQQRLIQKYRKEGEG